MSEPAASLERYLGAQVQEVRANVAVALAKRAARRSRHMGRGFFALVVDAGSDRRRAD
jgi:hypothetical protein